MVTPLGFPVLPEVKIIYAVFEDFETCRIVRELVGSVLIVVRLTMKLSMPVLSDQN